jgi:outer membrane receptor for ferrienterochelin and colicins
MKRVFLFFLVFCFTVYLVPQSGIADDLLDVQDLSLDSLLNLSISSAAKYEQKVSDAPASVSIITSEDIERYGYRTLEDVLMNVRGFYTSYDRNYTYVGVRGFGRPGDYNSRILLLINGHTMNDNVYGQAAVGTELSVNLEGVERIEIVRGPGSALYGTNAMFAVVNVVTKKAKDVDGLELTAGTGSYGRKSGWLTFGKELDNGVELFCSGLWADIKGDNPYFSEYDDFSTNYGVAEDLDWDKYYGGVATVGYNHLKFQGLFTWREKGVPTASWETAFNESDNKTLDDHTYIEAKYENRVTADKNLMLRAYYDHYHYKGWFPYEVQCWDATDGNFAGSELQFLWDVKPNDRLTIGAEYQNHIRADYRLWDEEYSYFDDDFPFNLWSLYLQNEYQVRPNLSLTLGVRRDEYSTVGSATTPRAAVVYNPLKSGTFKLLYGEAFRAPNIYEVNYDDPDLGYIPNYDLKPERIQTTEVVWEQRLTEQLLGVLCLYNYNMKDLIEQKYDPSDELIQFQNTSKIKASGLELELNARLHGGISGYANYTLQKTEVVGSDRKLENSPSHLIKLGVGCPTTRFLYTAAQFYYETERITVFETKTKPFLLTNLNITTKPIFNHLRVSLLVRNLFDATYKFPGALEHLQDAITQDRRNIVIKLSYSS